VQAREQHDRPSVVVPLDPGQGVQTLAGEPLGEQWQEVRDGGLTGELVVAGVQEPLDGLGAERAGELLAQAACGGDKGELLVDSDGDVRCRGAARSSPARRAAVSGVSWAASCRRVGGLPVRDPVTSDSPALRLVLSPAYFKIIEVSA
jgi:hypothetical protein